MMAKDPAQRLQSAAAGDRAVGALGGPAGHLPAAAAGASQDPSPAFSGGFPPPIIIPPPVIIPPLGEAAGPAVAGSLRDTVADFAQAARPAGGRQRREFERGCGDAAGDTADSPVGALHRRAAGGDRPGEFHRLAGESVALVGVDGHPTIGRHGGRRFLPRPRPLDTLISSPSAGKGFPPKSQPFPSETPSWRQRKS